MRKPIIKLIWKGVKGNKWRAWDVTFDGKVYHHQNKYNAHRQYKAALKVYAKRKRF